MCYFFVAVVFGFVSAVMNELENDFGRYQIRLLSIVACVEWNVALTKYGVES